MFDIIIKYILDLDLGFMAFLNQFGHSSQLLNKTTFILATNNLLTNIPVMSMLWWAWFKGDVHDDRVRRIVMSTFLACLFTGIALLFVRDFQLFGDVRLRPNCNPSVNFQVPEGLIERTMEDCRSASPSFPSGHTALLTAIGMGLIYISPTLGIGCLIFSFFAVLIPRLYVGFHFLSDIFGGILIGICSLYLARTGQVVKLMSEPLLEWSKRNPPSFYAVFFIASYLVATFFKDIRTILQELF